MDGMRNAYTINPVRDAMKYTVVLEKDEDGVYIVTVPALPGCISDGKTVEEALINIKEAIQGFIEDMIVDGESIPNDVEIIGNVEINA
jgi:predicted RNase H-like HicB family nuclease